jgi:hypothetical protein
MRLSTGFLSGGGFSAEQSHHSRPRGKTPAFSWKMRLSAERKLSRTPNSAGASLYLRGNSAPENRSSGIIAQRIGGICSWENPAPERNPGLKRQF